jgi:hypothetical protein
MLKKILVLSIFVSIVSVNAFSQKDIKSEAKSETFELGTFNEIFYHICHEATPNRDYQTLRNYLKDINSLSDKLINTKLPANLRDKQKKWDEGIRKLKVTVKNYNDAANSTDNEKLLASAEEIHINFETLILIIKPIPLEVENFRNRLYVVCHYYSPDKSYYKILKVKSDFVKKAEACLRAQLPKEMIHQKGKFLAAVQDLITATKTLKMIKSPKEGTAIEKAVADIHTKYVALQGLFE